MAIYSLHHNAIGKTSHAPRTAGSHIRYMGREDARPEILTDHMPADVAAARSWVDRYERESRANARVADTLMVALPRELGEHQRAELVRRYMDELGKGEIPYFAAIHQKGKDATNPHAHILLCDKSVLNGRRVIGTSERGSTTKFREKWSESVNMALSEANLSERVDHRSYADQGIDKEPGTHRGPNLPGTWADKIRSERGCQKFALVA